jgi:ParB family chromosome partitioning protein
MIGDFRTDALHEALARAPIEEDTLMALLVLAFAGRNVSVDSGSSDTVLATRGWSATQPFFSGKAAGSTTTVRCSSRSHARF